MQPTFIPWAGYFNLICSVNEFIFLDDVQLERQSWQTRNRIIINKNVHWIGLPVRGVKLSQKINETEIINNPTWSKKLEKSFVENYGKHPYFPDAKSVIDFLLSCRASRLSELNGLVIKFIANRLRINTGIHFSSDYENNLSRTSKLIYLCDKFACDEYLSPVGSAAYLTDDDFVGRSNTRLIFQSYTPEAYPQKNSKEFISNLSIIDVIANIGWDKTAEYIKGK